MDRRSVVAGILLGGVAAAAHAAPLPAGYPRSYARIIEAAKREKRLTIYSATDAREFGDLLAEFRAVYPFVAIDYQDLSAFEVYRRFLDEANARRVVADLVMNSAMDLQIKLVNDRYAQPYASPEKPNLPDWAVWKNEAYAVSAEPIVFAYNKRLLPASEVPRTHDDLQRLLESQGGRYRRKIATYDPAKSSTGYLYLSQDVLLDRDTWSLIRALGGAELKTYISSDEMIRKVRSGEHILAYNMIGSYALDMRSKDPNFGVVIPEDYTLIASRIALIPRDAPHPNAAKLFIDFMLSKRGQSLIANHFMTPLRSDVSQRYPRIDQAKVRNIRVGPALLVGQDQMKRALFLKEWRRALSVPAMRVSSAG